MPLSPEYKVLRESVELQTDHELFFDLLTNYHNICAKWWTENRNNGGLVKKEFGQVPFLSETFDDKGNRVPMIRNIPFDLQAEIARDFSQSFCNVSIEPKSLDVKDLFVFEGIGVKAVNIYSIWDRQNSNDNNYQPFSLSIVRVHLKGSNADGYVYICGIQSLIPIPDLAIIRLKKLLGKVIRDEKCSEDSLKLGMVAGLSLVVPTLEQLVNADLQSDKNLA